MDFRRWDEAHDTLWRIADCAALLEVRDRARQAAREAEPLLAQASSSHGWTAEKAHVLGAMDAQGLTVTLASALDGLTLPLALSVWELASVDAGVATCSLSGSLAQMPIRDFGTPPQRDRYLGQNELNNFNLRHGALCLTEPLPGAGADAIFLAGRMVLVGADANGEPLLEIRKRGRFTSHMDFAEFVLVAVEGDGDGVRGSALVILEAEDVGDFERGEVVRKLGHRFASTTHPAFNLKVQASRIVGGYTVEEGALVPRFNHRALLEPTLRRMRALLGVMTASKALSTVQECLASSARKCNDAEFTLDLADLWATGEAAASLGFCAVRLGDELDGRKLSTSSEVRRAGVFSSAAKLFSSNRVAESLRQVAAWGESGAQTTIDLSARMMDAQIEDMYMGPTALQRRMISAAMADARWMAEFERWIEEADALAEGLPRVGMRSVAEGMQLWRWTMEQMRQQVDAHGARLYCDARQSVAFPMADALCQLLAARSLALDVLEMDHRSPDGECAFIFCDLGLLAAGRAASRTLQICAGLLCGHAGRFPLSGAARRTLAELQANLCISLRGMLDARERIAKFLRSTSGNL